MSKTRYKWWGFVKSIIRAYPAHCSELKALRAQTITARYGASTGGSSDTQRTAESVALRELLPEDMREYRAVEAALLTTRRNCATAAERTRLISMVFFEQTHTLQGAALALNVSYGTAKNWHNDFIKLTAKKYGLNV